MSHTLHSKFTETNISVLDLFFTQIRGQLRVFREVIVSQTQPCLMDVSISMLQESVFLYICVPHNEFLLSNKL